MSGCDNINNDYNNIEYQRNHYGIYCIECMETSVKYIGQTYENFYRRWIFHKWNLKTNQHNNTYLQNAWNKYGADSFKFYPIESFELSQKDVINKQKLDKMEQYYIEKYNTFKNGFNLTTGGDECKMSPLSDEAKRKIGEKNRVNMLGKKHSEETKKKMSEAHKKIMKSEDERKKRSEKLTGIKRSEEHKEKLKLANQGTKSNFAKYTEEFIGKIRIEYMNGIKQKELVSKYNIKPTTLNNILAHRTWKHVIPEGWQEFLISRKTKNKLNR